MISAFLRYLKLRRKRRYLKWVNRMLLKQVVFEKPKPDNRLWSTKYMESIRGRRY